jgi:hypothetical protein
MLAEMPRCWIVLVAVTAVSCGLLTDEAAERLEREQRVHAALASIREDIAASMFYAAQDEWDRAGEFRPDVAMSAMNAAARAAERLLDPVDRADELGCAGIESTHGTNEFDDFDLMLATPNEREREAKSLVVYTFAGTFDAIPTKEGDSFIYWYVLVIGRGCPAAPSLNETVGTWSESIEIEPEPPPDIGVGY